MNLYNKNKIKKLLLINLLYLGLIFSAQSQEIESPTTFDDIISASEASPEDLEDEDEDEDDIVIDKDELEEIQKLADEGDKEAQFKIGYYYFTGLGKPQSYKDAYKWYTLASDQGEQFSSFNLGHIFYTGLYTYPRNLDTSFKYFKKSAEMGNAIAQYFIGLMYKLGDGIKQDKINSYVWINMSAAQENKEAIKLRKWYDRRLSKTELISAQEISKRCFDNKYKNC